MCFRQKCRFFYGKNRFSYRKNRFKLYDFTNQNSTFSRLFPDLSVHLVEYLKLCVQGKFDEVRHHLSQLQNCVNWLDPSFKITPAPKGDSDSDSESGSDDDMDMSDDDDDDDEAPELIDSNQRSQRNRPTTDDDGWTTIPTRRR